MNFKKLYLPDHSCHARGRTVPCGRSWKRACSPTTTCPTSSRTSTKNIFFLHFYMRLLPRLIIALHLLLLCSPKNYSSSVRMYLIVNQEFRSFEISGSYSNVVLLARVIELGEAPIDQTQLPILVINHHVVWLDIPVHDAHAVAVVQGLEEFVQVESDVVIRQSLKRMII